MVCPELKRTLKSDTLDTIRQDVRSAVVRLYHSEESADKYVSPETINSISEVMGEAGRVLGFNPPPFDIILGFAYGFNNYNGYCFDDDQGVTHVALDVGFFNSLDEDMQLCGRRSFLNLVMLPQIIGEENYHAFLRQHDPETSEASIKANQGTTAEYWSAQGEIEAKAFAQVFSQHCSGNSRPLEKHLSKHRLPILRQAASKLKQK